MQILKGLYQVGGDLNGITWAGFDAGFDDGNTYALDTGDAILLFDCGCGDTWDQICGNMRYWNLDPARIRCCLLTHSHLDHAGAAHLLKQAGIEIIAHTNTADAVASGDERCCGFVYHKTFVPCEVDRQVHDGEILELYGLSIQVLHFPGHTMGCTAYAFSWEGKGLVVSGDVIGTLNVGDFGWSGSIDFNKPAYMESLRRFARMDFDMMLSGHGLVYFHKPRRRVEQVLNEALIQWR
jgi:glyoxylase-like metal-dependent hydrolase (beta-lactamase superfamily II)